MFMCTKSAQRRLTWLTFPTISPRGLNKRGEQSFEVRIVLETPMQDTGTARERKFVRRSVFEAELAAANSASREREFSAWVSREQDASEAKENLNNLDTKALGREVISSCVSGLRSP